MTLFDQFEVPDRPSRKQRNRNAVAATLGTIVGLTPNVVIIVTHSLPEWVYLWLAVTTTIVLLQVFVRASLFSSGSQ